MLAAPLKGALATADGATGVETSEAETVGAEAETVPADAAVPTETRVVPLDTGYGAREAALLRGTPEAAGAVLRMTVGVEELAGTAGADERTGIRIGVETATGVREVADEHLTLTVLTSSVVTVA